MWGWGEERQHVLGEVNQLRVTGPCPVRESEHEIGLIAAVTHHFAPSRWMGLQVLEKIPQFSVFVSWIMR